MNNIENIKTLLSKINSVYTKMKQVGEERRKRGEYFNVFNILGLWSERVRLHSSFLAELLNPSGSYGIGDAFLGQFLQLVIEERSNYIQSNKVSPEVVERYIGPNAGDEGGRLGIIIEDGNHTIVIENKIHAVGQKCQPLRYDNYSKKHFRYSDNYYLAYLTLDGHEASEISTGNQPLKYVRMSYNQDIRNWLYKCAQLAYDEPLVRETIKQYIYFIRQLTNRDMEAEDKRNIAKLAMDYLRATSALVGVGAEISTLLREQHIIRPLKLFAEKNNYSFDIEHDGCIRFKPSSWKRHRISVTSDRTNWQNLCINIDSGEEGLLRKKLDCLNLNSNAYWTFGSEWPPTGYDSWSLPPNYLRIRSEEIADWIKKKVQTILTGVEKKHISM